MGVFLAAAEGVVAVGVFFAAAEGVEDAVDELLPPEWLQAPTMTKNKNTPPTSHGHFFFFFFGSIRSTATGPPSRAPAPCRWLT
ncbi:hypothetical protein MMAN_53130 [Mycobacterium mantenii]|uniref:Uncharacterized protein n=1 Tax=Mycobacterium mantenii TaxID=560555 RepID=A0A1X0FNV1_MYCNT|nr:hypothetical protein BST30_18460 [Mycobacterium mantenii]BBY41179.1 hypothetical protein MMAN_53130 [Mycobacterium mantenii]